MARIGISITKSISFRGSAQEFANTYYYDAPEPVDAAQCQAAIGLIETLEKSIHATSVTFVRGRAWTAGGTQAQNNMLADVNLTGTGSKSANTAGLDRERAFLVRIRAGVDSKGRPVYLRKYWHLDVSTLASSTLSAGQLQNTAQLSTAQRNELAAAYDTLKSLSPTGASGAWELVSRTGRDITGATVAHPYIEHHQLGDMWRG